MAKRQSLKLAALAEPKGDTAGSTADRVDTLEKAMTEARGVNYDKDEHKVQRSRAGMKKVTVHMNPEAHKALRMFCMQHDVGLEKFIITSINERLTKIGANFIVEW